MNKGRKPGYQNRPDSMRKLADKILTHPGTYKEYVSPSAISKKDEEQPRLYKTGGSVKKFAMGGSAKVRKGATKCTSKKK